MKKTIRLQTKLTILVILVVFISISIIILFVTSWMTNNIESKVKTNIMNVAEIVAHSPEVKKALEIKDKNKIIGIYVNSLLKEVAQIEYIIVVDMNEIRYSHPNPQMIGKKFTGGDEYNVLNKGETYISEASGTLGKALRAFTPIYDINNKQIGFVAVGTLTHSIEKSKHTAIMYLILITLGALTVGIIGAFLLAKNIKKTLLGLEPQDIAKLYNEKMSIIDAIHEGLVAVDKNGQITLINDSALKILQLENEYNKNQIIGQKMDVLFPTTRLLSITQLGLSEYDQEQYINNTLIMTNRVPIKDKQKIIGAIATFRDKTEVTNLAEELTGVRQIVEALRANNHEFMNKLHVILGLIHIGELDDAKKYITNITEKTQKLLSEVTNKIKNPTIAALMLGKFSRAKELKINLIIDEATNLENNLRNISNNALVTIIGNLIENAMEAASKSIKEDKYVNVRIQESTKEIKIMVQDSGIGIEQKYLKTIFERGYTTKAGSSGIGLALVKEAIDNLEGKITVTSQINKGTIITVILPNYNTHI
ncbi:DcuS/MalK family sensor histidine kinase [Clostridium algoriphilum]|uniref:DcuS/MalK family sensor histidine kinase n=1 Tax=Clostridium algoriphilum TaxID=198347 RepID=UPI001CF28EEB|nr:DcuS/MalK family sensor histidine kinase [Clostridium algoriphilum]MCB2295237.1 DcuS/MalK family sensor histidine kinase [Clostridium algoriphilum]